MCVQSQSLLPNWTVACQAPISMEFSEQSTAVGCHFLLQESSDPGIEPKSYCLLLWQAILPELPGKPCSG